MGLPFTSTHHRANRTSPVIGTRLILSNKNILNQNTISEKFDSENSSFIVIPSKVVDFDANQYFCCDKHRMILSSDNNIEVGSFKVVINKEGIIGQTLKLNNNFFEVILLSDKNHNIPIENNNADSIV